MKNKIYFNIRPASRDRMWDTIYSAEHSFQVSTPEGVSQSTKVRKFMAQSWSFKSYAREQLSKVLINRQSYDLKSSEGAEVLYFWGAFPKQPTTKRYIVELDNPYSLCYYNRSNFERNKKAISEKLKSCSAVTFMSETCRNHSFDVYGKESFPRNFVLYPYVNNNLEKHDSDSGVTNILFIGIDFRRKGGPELLEAFANTADPTLRLTVIADVSHELQSQFGKDSRVTFMPLVNRKELFETIFPKMDVLALPSMHESFGMVLLEAMSFGLALIAVDAYATKEMVINNYNGYLIPHPIIAPTSSAEHQFINCVEHTINDFAEQYLNSDEFYYGLYKDLKLAFEKIGNEKKRMMDNSTELFLNKFSPDCWESRFKEVMLDD
ncbi:glycosyltransferase family 4 protein [Vibrio sp. 10N.286.48.B7]|uniref:glycosyltransferase family 4 protein n=1 Tax=Vibrio sp. 10N.286.48.B7 TaxID=1880853 RepID=UPI000C84C2DF|nr:glycosyltransferase family 4 protein [Vibrio sp. 10N.286.48.B7]